MLHHHGSTPYPIALSQAATAARSKMEAKIETGKASAARLWESVHSQVPVDALVRGRGLKFGYGLDLETDAPITVQTVEAKRGGEETGLVKVEPAPMTIHRHALQQMASKAGIPGHYLTDLVQAPEAWKRELAARTLNDFFSRSEQGPARHLIRAVGGEVRACLSDKFRRLDSRPLVDAFAEECQALGAVPVEGVCTDVRVALKAFLPMVFEPVENEVMCLGVEWSNSDFGAGKHALRAFIYRLWCANGATMEDAMSQVHLGGRLSDTIEFSQRTYDFDTKTSVSALRDVVRGTLGPAPVSQLLETIKQADAKKIEWKSVSTLLAKRLLKEELKAVKDAFESDDVINLPAEKSIWRASNAISWIAGKTEDQDRQLDLQRLAGAVIHGHFAEAEAA